MTTTQELFKDKKLPQYIYKFCSVNNNLFKLLLNSKLWFAAPTTFNDPFDCQLNDQTIWTNEKIIKYYKHRQNIENPIPIEIELLLKKNTENQNWFKDNFAIALRDNTLATIGVSCFTSKLNNPLLWSHYGVGHTGICLKFDILKDEELFKNTHKVNYTLDYPEIKMSDSFNYNFDTAILSKSKVWEYENEIRVIKNKFGLFPFEKTSLVEVIFGCKISTEDKQTIKNIIKNNNYKKTKLFQSNLYVDKYDLQFDEEIMN